MLLLLHCVKQNPHIHSNLLIILFSSFIQNLHFYKFTLNLHFFSFCSNESTEFEKNIRKVFALSLELKENRPISFNDILDCLPLCIPRDFNVYQRSPEFFLFSGISPSKESTFLLFF